LCTSAIVLMDELGIMQLRQGLYHRIYVGIDTKKGEIPVVGANQLRSHTPLRYALREECTRCAGGGLGLELSFLFNTPFPQSLWRSGR
jgi:hypothetical protein